MNASLPALRVKATVRVPSPSVAGLRPHLRRGRLVALRPQCLARLLSGLPCVVWCQERPTFGCQRQGHLRQRLCQTMARTRMAMTTAMCSEGKGRSANVTLKRCLMLIGEADCQRRDWHTVNKQYRLGGYNFVVAALSAGTSDVAHLPGAVQASSCRSLAAFGRVVGDGAASADTSFRLGKAGAEPRQHRAALLQRGLLGGGVLGMVSSRFFDGRALEVSTRQQAHCRCTTPHLQDPVSSGLRSARTLFLAPRAISQRICFCLSEDTDLGEVFVKTWETKKCMLDEFSAAYIAKYKVTGFDDPEGKIVLQQVAQSMRMDTAAMFVHQSCTTVPPLTRSRDDFLRARDWGCDCLRICSRCLHAV